MGKAEEAPDRVHHRDDGGVHQSRVAELADVQLDTSSLNALQRVKSTALAPGETTSQLECVQPVRVPRVAGEVGDSGQLGRGHLGRLEREERGCA